MRCRRHAHQHFNDYGMACRATALRLQQEQKLEEGPGQGLSLGIGENVQEYVKEPTNQ